MMTLIVGAGLTGLIIANRLKTSSNDDVLLVEKSRGVGGRMATRRIENARFDHGAQFYALREPLDSLHKRWLNTSLVKPWFDRHGVVHFSCTTGMTALAKDLADAIDVRFEQRVVELFKTPTGWRTVFESGAELFTDRVILTCPLPQALEILKASHLAYDPHLDLILYAKAVVALIQTKSGGDSLASPNGYTQLTGSQIFSIADQRKKGLSEIPSLTVTLTPESSDAFFETPDESVIGGVIDELKRRDPTFSSTSVQIKKWRFSHPLQVASMNYANPHEQLFIAGDAFGGPSLNGAAKSANALSDALTGSKR